MVAISAPVASPAPTPPAPAASAYSGTTDSSRKNPVMAPNEATNTSARARLKMGGRGSCGMLPSMSQIVWWEIETPDPEAFQAFHGAMWGWTFERAFEDTELEADYWIIQAGGRGIGGLQRAATATPPHPGARLYVEVDDLEAALATVETRGGRVERRRTALGGDDRWYGTAWDPTGVSFGLWTEHPGR